MAENKLNRRREMGFEGRLKPVDSYSYKGHLIPGKCRPERAKSFFEDEKFMPPRIVSIEPSSACNLKCLMCPTYLTTKKHTLLDFNLFKRIVNETKDFQSGFVFQGTGEPMLHPRLFEMVEYAKKNSIQNILISSNGTKLTDEHIEKILNPDTSPHFIQFSIDGHSKELYEKYRYGASFDSVYEGVKKLQQLRNTRNLISPEITINTLYSSDFNLDLFLDMWGDLVDDITVSPMLKQAKQLKTDDTFLNVVQDSTHLYISCPKPYEIISILSSGLVTHCQHDYHQIHIKGDLNTGESLLDIWRNKAYHEFRKLHIEGRAEETTCHGCASLYRIKNEKELFLLREKVKDFFYKRDN